jgi:hypothetical protein
VTLTVFCVLPLAALIVFWTHGPRTTLLMAASMIESAVVLTLAAQIILYADLKDHDDPERAPLTRSA